MHPLLSDYEPYLNFGDYAEAYVEESSSLSIRWEEGRVESLSQTEDSGVGLRYLWGQQSRFGYATLPSPLSRNLKPSEKSTLQALSQSCAEGFPSLKSQPNKKFETRIHPVKIDPQSWGLNEKTAYLKHVFEAAHYGPHIRQININYGEKKKKVGFINSTGDSYLEEKSYMVFSIMVTVARHQEIQTAYDSLGGIGGLELIPLNQVLELAKKVSQRAHDKLNAPPAPAGTMPVVIASSAGGTLIHEAIGHSLEADAVFEGSSPAYLGKIGQVVAHPKLTVYDNPTVPSARGSFFFDDEGVRSEATKLIENGVLKNYLFDRLSAQKAKTVSNGHGRRESFRHRPIPRMSNTYVAPGTDDPQKIIKEFQNGFLVTKMGGGQVNPVNGDFVFEVEEGFHVKEGQHTLVRGATLLGNGPQLLFDIDQIGSDHGWAIGTCGKEGQGVPVSDALPTVHIKKMVVGGGS